ncbi:hypothetical protein BASH2_02751 [Bacillus anthracis]|nr:hypothetical protein BASH2_02751 [Bacillus anthracis]
MKTTINLLIESNNEQEFIILIPSVFVLLQNKELE